MTNKDKEERQLDRAVGQTLKYHREKKGLSLADLCKLIPGSISASYLNRVENGERRAISVKLLQNWCKALDVNFCKLLNAPEDASDVRTFFDLVVQYKYIIGNGISSTPEIGASISSFVDQVEKSDFTGENAHRDAILILKLAKELHHLLKH